MLQVERVEASVGAMSVAAGTAVWAGPGAGVCRPGCIMSWAGTGRGRTAHATGRRTLRGEGGVFRILEFGMVWSAGLECVRRMQADLEGVCALLDSDILRLRVHR